MRKRLWQQRGKIAWALLIFVMGCTVVPLGLVQWGDGPAVILYSIATISGMGLWIVGRNRPQIRTLWWVLLPLGAAGIVTLVFLFALVLLLVMSGLESPPY